MKYNPAPVVTPAQAGVLAKIPAFAGMTFLLILFFLPGVVFAVQPNEMLSDQALEARARNISQDLRCLVCQNQSIDDSDASLAHDLCVLVRQRLKAGDSDAEVKQYIVSRYGDYVLLNPPFKSVTYALWLGPLFFLCLAVVAIILFFRARRQMSVEPIRPLTAAENARLQALLGDKEPEP